MVVNDTGWFSTGWQLLVIQPTKASMNSWRWATCGAERQERRVIYGSLKGQLVELKGDFLHDFMINASEWLIHTVIYGFSVVIHRYKLLISG